MHSSVISCSSALNYSPHWGASSAALRLDVGSTTAASAFTSSSPRHLRALSPQSVDSSPPSRSWFIHQPLFSIFFDVIICWIKYRKFAWLVHSIYISCGGLMRGQPAELCWFQVCPLCKQQETGFALGRQIGGWTQMGPLSPCFCSVCKMDAEPMSCFAAVLRFEESVLDCRTDQMCAARKLCSVLAVNGGNLNRSLIWYASTARCSTALSPSIMNILRRNTHALSVIILNHITCL